MSEGPLRHLGPALLELERSGLLRVPPEPAGGALVLCSNDYLGYAQEGWSAAPGTEAVPSGAGASRLVSGEHPAHSAAERALAEWLGAPAALLFSSGYAANVGLVAALAGRGDVIVSDALNHASIIDGCRLSGATVVVAAHRDVGAVERALGGARGARRRWVVTESCFSMEGDHADLVGLRAACDAHDAGLLVDEAHAVGVFGPGGAGLCRAAGVRAEAVVATLGKAVGLQGACVAGSHELRAWLWNRARSFVFSTGVTPSLAQAVPGRVARVRGDDAGRARLLELTACLRGQLLGAGVPIGPGAGPIIPWVVGSPEVAVERARALRERGVVVQAIRPPTVPEGTSRLRISVHARLTDGEVDAAVAALVAVHRGGARATVSRETSAGGSAGRAARARIVAVVGTGTGVGKTHAAVALVAAAVGAGRRACGLKPIETGGGGGVGPDGAALASASVCPVAPAPFTFADPVSPHLAARRAGRRILLDEVEAWVRGHDAELCVVETAGGLMSPLGPGSTNLDLVERLAPEAVVLVAVDRLGVLHEVSACLTALRGLGTRLPPAVVVLQPPAVPDASTGTNAAELETLGVARDVAVFPWGDAASCAVGAAAGALLARVRACFT